MMRGTTRGTEVSRLTWSILVIGFCMLVLPVSSYGQERLDLQAIAQETQRSSQDPEEVTVVWWLPEQFWQASLRQQSVDSAKIEQFLKIIHRYTLIAVVDARVGALGGVTFRSEDAVRTSVTLKDAKGTSYAPLAESAVDPDMKNLVQILKPIIANLLGPIGQNMHFVLFPSKSDTGQPVADPASEGTLGVLVRGKEFNYRLPLGSVLPPKHDPVTKEVFPGNYNYNPFTGAKLAPESSNKPL